MTIAITLCLAGFAVLAVVVGYLALVAWPRRLAAMDRRLVEHQQLTASSVMSVQGQYLKARAGMSTGRFTRPAQALDRGPN